MVETTEPEMKPITLRGSGTYIVTLSGDSECFQVYEGNEEISNLKIKLTAGKDLVLGVKFKPKENGKIYSAILTLASTTNRKLLNNLSLGLRLFGRILSVMSHHKLSSYIERTKSGTKW